MWRILRCPRIDTLKIRIALLQLQIAKTKCSTIWTEGKVLACVYYVSVGVLVTCRSLFLEHGSRDSTVGMCSWNDVKHTGSLPLPDLGANSDIYVREVLPHASSHLLPGLWTEWKCWEARQCQSHCCQLAPGHPPSWCLAQPLSSTLWWEQQSGPVHYRSSTCTKGLCLHKFLSLEKPRSPEKIGQLRIQKLECQEYLACIGSLVWFPVS